MPSSILAILIGVLSGVVAAVCGVGGGIIMVPAFVLLIGMPQKTAVASSLAAIILTALVATLKNHLNELIDWRVAIPSALSGALVAWFAADALKHLSNLTLTRIFAAVMILVGVRMLFQK
ncbi:MAG: sulfite exporter TauE/SafE family protein [Verrucomicrobiota bacterium]|nr:sulfite exporter TauE/SafE family protein [Verrucomicrobiota bacterium]